MKFIFTLFLLFLSAYRVCASDLPKSAISLEECLFHQHLVSNDGKYFTRYYSRIDSSLLGKVSGDKAIQVIRIDDGQLLFDSTFVTTQFSWSHDIPGAFYFTVHLDNWVSMQRDVEDGLMGFYPWSKSVNYSPYLGKLANTKKDPLYADLRHDNQVARLFESPINSNLGYIPTIRRNPNWSVDLIHKTGPVYENKIIKHSGRKDKLFDINSALHYWIDKNGNPYLVATLSENRLDVIIQKYDTKENKLVSPPTLQIRRDLLTPQNGPGWKNLDFFPIFDKDNHLIKLFSVDSLDTNYAALNQRDASSLTLIKTLYVDKEYDVTRPHFDKQGNPIGVQIYKKTDTFLPLNKTGQKLEKLISKVSLKESDQDIIIHSVALDKDIAIVEVANSNESNIYWINSENNKIKRLPQQCINRGLETDAFQITLKNGETVHSYITGKANLPDTAPILVSLHGGPRSRDTFRDHKMLEPWFLENGWKILKINYRGSSGYGKKFMSALKGNAHSFVVEDIIATLDYLKLDKHVAPEHTIVLGNSFGGYQVLNIATSSAHKYFDAFIAINSPIYLPELDIRFQEFNSGFFGSLSDKNILNTVTHRKPLLIAWGKHDVIVNPTKHSLPFASKNKDANVTTIELSNSGHTLVEHDVWQLTSLVEQEILSKLDN